MPLVPPHGPEAVLIPCQVSPPDRPAWQQWAKTLTALPLSSREASDLLMLGMGAFTPLTGFMTRADWQTVTRDMKLADGTFWPIPITLSASAGDADPIGVGQHVALTHAGQLLGVMQVADKYAIDPLYECEAVFGTRDPSHPGVAKVLAQGGINLGGPVKVLTDGPYRDQYPHLLLTPQEMRHRFQERGWSRVAALQTRNPLHRSHEYLAKLALEVSDGLLIHQVLGQLKADDIPAAVRVVAVEQLVRHYFVPGTVIQAGYPMEMRYAGPREALLHAIIRQNFGVSHLVVGRDHAGVGHFYGPYDAQRAFSQLPPQSLHIRALAIDVAFYCERCDQMATLKTCPHSERHRVIISGTELRRRLAAGEPVPGHFSRPEVVRVLERYYRSLATQDALGFVGPSGDTTATRHTRHKPADAHGTSDGHGK